MDEQVQVRMVYNPAEAPIFVDACQVMVHILDGKPERVMFLAVHVSPIPEPDGTRIGTVVGKWIMPLKAAQQFAKEIHQKLDEVEREAATSDDGE